MTIVVVKNNGLATETCLISKNVASYLSVQKGKKYSLIAGLKSARVTVLIDEDSKDKIMVTEQVFNKLYLVSNYPINVRLEKRKIHLGPVVGIFVSPRYLKDIEEGIPPVSAWENVRANFIKTNCLLYFFTFTGVDYLKRKVRGWIYRPNLEMWQSLSLPFPQVVYDRGVKFYTDEKELVNKLREELDGYSSCQRINSRDYLHKWETHKRLVKYPELNVNQPDTIRYEGPKDLANFLNKYQEIFLKSYFGSRGSEVIKIKRKDIRTWHFHLQERKIELEFDELVKKTEEFFEGRRFILQEGLKLLTYKENPMDFRVLVQKNECGQWMIAYNQARVAHNKQYLTNISMGGSIYYTQDLFAKMLPKPEVDALLAEINNTALRFALCIEREFGPMGEVGLDLAVTQDKRVWFIEANTKPDKDPEPIDGPQECYSFFTNIFFYSLYLTGHSLAKQ